MRKVVENFSLKLLPCPFCGGNQVKVSSVEDIEKNGEIIGYNIEIKCFDCYCTKFSTSKTSLEKAIERAETDWNNRITSTLTKTIDVDLCLLDKRMAR